MRDVPHLHDWFVLTRFITTTVPILFLSLVTASCRDQRPLVRDAVVASRVTETPRSATEVPTTATETLPIAMEPPSGLCTKDSVAHALPVVPFAITSAGDTIKVLGGGMMDDVYGVDAHQTKTHHCVQIERSLGHKPDGKPIWRVVRRLAFPSQGWSEELFFGGFCRIDGTGDPDTGDPFVIAVAVVTDAPKHQDAWIYRDIRGAWRFEPATETLRELPIDSVSCWSLDVEG